MPSETNLLTTSSGNRPYGDRTTATATATTLDPNPVIPTRSLLNADAYHIHEPLPVDCRAGAVENSFAPPSKLSKFHDGVIAFAAVWARRSRLHYISRSNPNVVHILAINTLLSTLSTIEQTLVPLGSFDQPSKMKALKKCTLRNEEDGKDKCQIDLITTSGCFFSVCSFVVMEHVTLHLLNHEIPKELVCPTAQLNSRPADLLQRIYRGYDEYDPHAFYPLVSEEAPEMRTKLEQCFRCYGGKDTEAIIRKLRLLVKAELAQTNKRLEEFNSLRKRYAEGRRDISAIIEENLKAARQSGFREGVCSEEEAQHVYDELGKVDNHLEKISEQLVTAKEFWENVDQRLKSPPSTPVQEQAKDPPNRITTGPLEFRIESQARKIHTGLQNIHQAAEQYSGSRSMRKAGDYLVRKASKLTTRCATISNTHRLQSQFCESKAARKVVAAVTRDFTCIARGYKKVSQKWTKYVRSVLLLFWFAGTTAAQKRGVERYDPLAHEVLLSKWLCSQVLPFESAIEGIGKRLHGIQKFWANIRFVGDFRFGVVLRNI
ncbi:hypothetical protein K438DRAFT_1971775 [Mycena galopus ATCC 62051]|nr:hypothetical protein K438DRAFT_1971775 [Mycena galopus ATCC 62051]